MALAGFRSIPSIRCGPMDSKIPGPLSCPSLGLQDTEVLNSKIFPLEDKTQIDRTLGTMAQVMRNARRTQSQNSSSCRLILRFRSYIFKKANFKKDCLEADSVRKTEGKMVYSVAWLGCGCASAMRSALPTYCEIFEFRHSIIRLEEFWSYSARRLLV